MMRISMTKEQVIESLEAALPRIQLDDLTEQQEFIDGVVKWREDVASRLRKIADDLDDQSIEIEHIRGINIYKRDMDITLDRFRAGISQPEPKHERVQKFIAVLRKANNKNFTFDEDHEFWAYLSGAEQ